MQTIRKVIDGERLADIVELPNDMRRGQVELIIQPINRRKKDGDPALLDGYLKEYANPELRALEEGAWERHVAEKYANT